MSNLFEYATGSDSFSALQPNYDARQVTLTAHVYNTKSGFFENPRSLTNGGDVCKTGKVHKAIPASTRLAVSVGNWYYYRAEVLGGALFCFEYKSKDDTAAFSFNTQFLLVRVFANAPLIRAKLNLPDHLYANVKDLDFVWNAQRVYTHDQMTVNERAAFKKLTGETSNFVVEATQDSSELISWEFTNIEKAAPPKKKVVKGKSGLTLGTNRVKKLRL